MPNCRGLQSIVAAGQVFGAVILLVIGAGVSIAQNKAVASSGLNVRKGRTTADSVVGHLSAGDTVTLVAKKAREGYFHVRTRGGVTGWAWAARLSVVSDGGGGGVRPEGSATGIAPSWSRVPSNAATDHGCPAIGHGTGADFDTATNRWKNRTDSTSAYHDLKWQILAALPVPRNSTKARKNWTQSDLDTLALFEGLPVRVVGFLSGAKVEGGESTNCGATAPDRVDWHAYLNSAPHGDHKHAIVIEATPRVRARHPNWKAADLQAATQNGDSVRISGWVMFDPLHYDQMWQYKASSDTTGTKARITLWEIHPVTRIEVFRNGAWVSLDQP